MKTDKMRSAGLIGPLQGLGYIIAFPFAGLFGIILLVSYFVKRQVVTFGHRVVQAIVKA
ncbi:MAG: hypothetical protein V1932_06030 [Chloroflexota bacterium]